MNRKPSLFSRLMTGLIFLFLYAPHLCPHHLFLQQLQKPLCMGRLHLGLVRQAVPRSNDPGRPVHHPWPISVLAAVIATVAGTFAAIGFYNMKKRWRTPLMTVNNIPMVNAEIVTGVSLCLFFVAFFNLWGVLPNWVNGAFGLQLPEQLYLGFGTMLIAHITFNIPYVILSIMPKLRQMDKNLVDAARPGLYLDAAFGMWLSRRSSRASSMACSLPSPCQWWTSLSATSPPAPARPNPGHAHLRHDQKRISPGGQRSIHFVVCHRPGPSCYHQCAGGPPGACRRKTAHHVIFAVVPS